jgi:hypothetical protein
VRDFDVDIFVDKKYKDDHKALIEHCPPIIFDIWDKDSGIMADGKQFLCRATIDVRDSSCIYIEN